jgi:hypothetical protein
VRRRSRRRIVAAAVVAIAVLVLAVSLAGAARGIALDAYVLAVCGLAAAALASRVRRAIPATPPFERLVPTRPTPETRVVQLEGLMGRLSGGEPNAFDLHHRVRPLVHQIATARLARGYAVDLDRRPERARALLGPRTWELVRPDRQPPVDHHGPSWSKRELTELVDELERI